MSRDTTLTRPRRRDVDLEDRDSTHWQDRVGKCDKLSYVGAKKVRVFGRVVITFLFSTLTPCFYALSDLL